MAKQVFFSFHYDDVKTFRANVVRNHGFTKTNGQYAGFFDASIWESSKTYGAESVKRLIDNNLVGTTVTCVLIGSNTWNRRWVRYEILKSYDRGNLLLGVHINSVPDKNKHTFLNGSNPFDYLGFVISNDGKTITYYEHNGINWNKYLDINPITRNFNKQYWGKSFVLSQWIPCFDWMHDDGYNNFPKWIEDAK